MSSALKALEIQELFTRYCYELDAKNADGAAACFSEDAQLKTFKGREEIAGFFRSVHAAMPLQLRHVVSNAFMVDDRGDVAEVKVYIRLYSIAGERISLDAIGVYDIEAVRGEDGWRLRRTEVSLDVPMVPGSGDLQRRLAVLEDERSIVALVVRSAHAFDDSDEDAYLACFTDDGAFLAVAPDGTDIVHGSGADGMRAFFRELHPLRAPMRHIVATERIDVDGDRAEVTSYWIVPTADGDRRPSLMGYGRYLDECVRIDDGTWRIRTRRAAVEGVVAT